MTEKRERDVLKESIKRQTEGNESIYFPSGREKRERNSLINIWTRDEDEIQFTTTTGPM